MGAKAKKSRHADCPPPIWDGLEWKCTNHLTPEVVEKSRTEYLAEVGKGEHRPKSRVAGVLVTADQAKKMEALAEGLAGALNHIAKLGEVVKELQERVGKLERAAKKKSS